MSNRPEGDSIFDPPADNLRRSVIGGAAVTALSQVAKILTQFASVVVLARLLGPEDFGVAAMAAPALAFVNLLQDLGLSQATVQRPKLTQLQASSLFWANGAAGLALGLLLLVAAPGIGLFYRDPRVAAMLAATAPLMVFNGFAVQYSALLNRQMRFKMLALIDAASVILSFVAAVVFALVWKSYWALYGAQVVLSLSIGLGAVFATRWRPSRPRRDPHLREMMGFGAGLTGFSLSNFFARNLDKVLIGRDWGGAAVGAYDRAYKLMLFPLQQISNPLGRVMLPALARLASEPDRYRSAYLRVVQQINLLAVPGVISLAVAADWLVEIALGPKWVDVIHIFQGLAIAAVVQPFNNPTGWLFISQRRSAQYARWGLFSAVTSAIAFIVGLRWGAAGVAAAYGLSELVVRSPVLWWYVGREGPVSTRDLFNAAAPAVAGGIVCALAVYGVRHLPLPAAPGFALAVVAAYASFLAVAALFPQGRGAIVESLKLIEGGKAMVLRRVKG